MMQSPVLEVSGDLQLNWSVLLEANGVHCTEDKPLPESLATLQEIGVSFPPLTDEELKSSSGYICQRGSATVFVSGAIHPTFNLYLISISFRPSSRLFRSGRDNAKLAQEITSILLKAGARVFDVDRWFLVQESDQRSLQG